MTVWDKSGNVLTGNGITDVVTDPDGISLTGSVYGTVVDTLGQTVVTANRTFSSGDTFDYKVVDVNGNVQTVTVKVNYAQIATVTAFGCGFQEITPNNPYYPTSVVYPDGETIKIGYEQNSLSALPNWRASLTYAIGATTCPYALVDSNGNLEGIVTLGTTGASQPAWNMTVGGRTTDGTVVWQNYGKTWTSGRIGSITYPEGGSVTYTYSARMVIVSEGQSNGQYFFEAWPSQITRTVNDNNGHSGTWTYQINAPSSNNATVTVTETDPLNNVTTLAFAGATQTGNGIPSWCTSGYSNGCRYTYIQTAKLSYNGAAVPQNLIAEEVTCYNGTNSSESGCVTPTVPIYFSISQTDVHTHQIGANGAIGTANDTQTVFDAYGNVTSLKRYDFGAAFPPSKTPLSTTTTVYNTGSTCGTLAVGAMKDRPCSVTVSGPSGTVSQVKYTYNAAGHPITTLKLVSGTTYLNSGASYNPNGTVASITDVNNAITNYYYNGTGGCSDLLLTSVVLPVNNLTTSQTWDCVGGVRTSSTDENGQVTNYGYLDQNAIADPMWRMRSTTDPLKNTTWNGFNTTSLPFTQETSLTFNNNASTVDKLTTVDGIGRTIVAQIKQSPTSSNFDTVSTAYDVDGRVASVSAPCVQTASLPCGSSFTTTIYDGLSRPLVITDPGGGTTSYNYVLNHVVQTDSKQRQMEYDGLGRLKSVCEITSASGRPADRPLLQRAT